jgi:D-alanyl-D-alanine carboxypeptidase/D-alanyl-D-alanine endopeptidase (penicillin-binding protein 7)
LNSRHALVVDEATGTVLLEKNANAEVPIASLTKLMTAMVVLDAQPDMDEEIAIGRPEVATKKRNRSKLPVGATLPRRTVLQIALMASDNRAAASLAHAYPGGDAAFIAAVHAKLGALGMSDTTIEEPTGLSSANRSTPADLVRMAIAAAQYPEIARITTDSREVIDINGSPVEYHNTNRLVGSQGWDILLSKTGYTTPAGRCLIMRLQSGEQTVIVVLLNAREAAARTRDAFYVRHLVSRDVGNRTQATARVRFKLAQLVRADG